MAARLRAESLNAVVEHVDTLNTQQQEAHSRLRKEVDALLVTQESNYKYFRERVEANASKIETLSHELQHTNSAPVSLDKIMFTPRVVGMMFGWLAATALTVVTSIFVMTNGWRSDQAAQRADQAALRSEVRELRTLIEAQRSTTEAREKLRDVEATANRSDMADVKRRLDMQQYDIQNVKDLITGRKKP